MFIKILVCTSLLLSTSLFAATDRAFIQQRVIQSLKIVKLTDLLFPDAVAGDIAYTIDASNNETLENASFAVNGEPGKVFRIILPVDNEVKLRLRGDYSNNSTIGVNNFRSNFRGNLGTIGNNGSQSLFVGATRESLNSNQKPGMYRGYFNVTVVY